MLVRGERLLAGLEPFVGQEVAESLRAKGVEFTEEPTERPYGIDCALRDPFGNPVRITQPAPGPVTAEDFAEHGEYAQDLRD